RLESMEARQLAVVRNELVKTAEKRTLKTADGSEFSFDFIGKVLDVESPEALKKLCFDIKQQLSDYMVVLCASVADKAHVAIGMSDSMAAASGLDAGKIIKGTVAPLIKGGGGGQKTLATAG